MYLSAFDSLSLTNTSDVFNVYNKIDEHISGGIITPKVLKPTDWNV